MTGKNNRRPLGRGPAAKNAHHHVSASVPDAAPNLAHDIVVVAPLSGVPTAEGTREDRTCDRCDVYVAPPLLFWPLVVRPRPNVCLVGGLCTGCRDREVLR